MKFRGSMKTCEIDESFLPQKFCVYGMISIYKHVTNLLSALRDITHIIVQREHHNVVRATIQG